MELLSILFVEFFTDGWTQLRCVDETLTVTVIAECAPYETGCAEYLIAFDETEVLACD